MLNPAWQENYLKGRYNRYPYDSIVTFLMRNFSKVDDLSNIRILDLGCGGGNNLKFLYEEGYDFRAIDGADESVKLSKEFLGLTKNDSRIVQGNFCDLPFEDEMFDAVIDRASLSCNRYEDIVKITSNIHKVLKPGGKYFGTDLFDKAHPDFKYGQESKNGDFSNFSEGNFFCAKEIHAFDLEQLYSVFSVFSDIKIKKITHENIEDNYKSNITSVFYEVLTIK